MARVTIEIPDDLLDKLRIGYCEVGKELRLASAFSLCSRGKLSTSQAARLAELTYADFLEAAALAKVELFPIAATLGIAHLRHHGMYLSDQTMNQALAQVGE